MDELKQIKISDQDELDSIRAWHQQRRDQLHKLREGGPSKALGSESLGSAWDWVQELKTDVPLDMNEASSILIDKDQERERLYDLQVQRMKDQRRGYEPSQSEDNSMYKTNLWHLLEDGHYSQK